MIDVTGTNKIWFLVNNRGKRINEDPDTLDSVISVYRRFAPGTVSLDTVNGGFTALVC